MKQKKVFVIGVGYVGLVTAVCLAEKGHVVCGADIDEKKIAQLSRGESPIYEAGLETLLKRGLESGRLSFQVGHNGSINDYEMAIIAVGTPERSKDGRANLFYVGETAKQIARHVTQDSFIVIGKSTVPIGTSDKIKECLDCYGSRHTQFHVGSNPETLREGSAVKDFMKPDRIIIGGDQQAQKVLLELYETIDCEKVVTDARSAELIKLVANMMLAQRISNTNLCAEICEQTGANIEQVMKGVGLDARLGPHFLQAGLGYGGSCFPKDTKNIRSIAERYSIPTTTFDAIIEANERQWLRFCRKVERAALFSLNKKRIAIWGLAFKPHTDDTREAPSVKIIEWLLSEGAVINVYDPVANVEREFGGRVRHCTDMYEACEGAEMLLIVTEWPQFREADLRKVRSLMEIPKLLDGRNVYDPTSVRALGFDYYSVGRP